MSQRDQSGSGQRGGRGVGSPPSRPAAFDDDGFELPVWGDTNTPARPGSRSNQPGRSQSSEAPRSERPRRSTGPERLPSLGDAFGRREQRRAPSESRSDFDETPREPVDDSYDRPRVRTSRQQRSAQVDEDDSESWSDQTERASYPGGTQAPRRRIQPARQIKAPNMGAAVQFANRFERSVVLTLGIGLVSLVLMVATVAARQHKIADWLPIHLNAAGEPDRWGSPATLWRLPLMAAMVTLMSAVLAWFASKRDAFAVQFILASTLLIQALCWIALVNLAW